MNYGRDEAREHREGGRERWRNEEEHRDAHLAGGGLPLLD